MPSRRDVTPVEGQRYVGPEAAYEILLPRGEERATTKTASRSSATPERIWVRCVSRPTCSKDLPLHLSTRAISSREALARWQALSGFVSGEGMLSTLWSGLIQKKSITGSSQRALMSC